MRASRYGNSVPLELATVCCPLQKAESMERSLLISTGVGCGVLCSYCPQSTIGKAYTDSQMRLSLEVFKTCVNKLPGDVTIDFTGFFEPWLNKDCTEMILYAHQQGYRVRASSTLMGMTVEDVDRICDIPFRKFAVHLPENLGLTKIKVTTQYLNVLEALIEREIRNLGLHLHEGLNGPEEPQEEVSALLARLNVVPENRWINSRAGNLDPSIRPAGSRLVGELAPCRRLKSNVLLPNGDVALCCMDWSLKHVMGNLLELEYDDLFLSEEYLRVLSGYSDDSIDIVCRQCEVARTKEDVAQSNFRKFVEHRKSRLVQIGD